MSTRLAPQFLGHVDDEMSARRGYDLAKQADVHCRAGGKLHAADGDDRGAFVDRADQRVGQALRRAILDEMDARAAHSLLAQPRSGDRGKVRLHGDDGAALPDADQLRKLGEDLAGTADDGHAGNGARKELRRRRPHRVQEPRLVLIGHPGVAVTRPCRR
jgi:hypothetical protein